MRQSAVRRFYLRFDEKWTDGMKLVHTMTVSVDDALAWELNKTCLSHDLVDRACDEAREQGLVAKDDVEQGEWSLEGLHFVVKVYLSTTTNGGK